ncbi:hypothetical protein [Paenibacillus aquistagni]|uniref:hypothetical protein n=1 Tax=Paenibacillus aquistagni TaxID=1852522 RepID=UPI00145BF0D5|nr:hypothetical protein [Paenibacillus aquistagni]NMM53520.1 hypothetical protein [Paenibacillus aquistagni]
MDKIRFLNQQELPVIRIIGGKEIFKGAQRDVLTMYFDTDVASNLEELVRSMGDTSLFQILQTNDGSSDREEVFEYQDYILLTKRSIEQEMITYETPVSPATYKDVYVVGLAQLTYAEKQLSLIAEN